MAGFFVNRFWFVTDDAFISFRYAANWAEGNGLRYNLGVDPPVEGFSNFLWTALLAVVTVVGLDMAVLAPWISSLLGLVLLAVTARFLHRLLGTRPGGQGGASWALFFLATFPPFFVWCTGGLETMLFALLLILTYERLLGNQGRSHGIQAGLCAALLLLTRPEGLIWCLALAVVYLADRRLFSGGRGEREKGTAPLGPLAAYTLVFIAAAACFWTFRILYFEKLLPNTAAIKVSLSGAVLMRGADYVVNFALTFVTPAVLVVASPFLMIRSRRRPQRSASRPDIERTAFHAVIMVLGCAGYSIAAGGDFMAMARFMVPAVPFLAILFAAAHIRIASATGMPPFALHALTAVLLAVQVLPAFNLDLMPESVRETFKFRWRIPHETKTEYEQWHYMNENQRKWAAAGKALGEYAKEGDSIVLLNIGAIGYYSRLHVHDECGLVDPDLAERPTTVGPMVLSAGHDKMVHPSFFLPKRPTYYQVRVIEDHEVPRYMAEVENFGVVPRGYAVKKIPLDRIDGAPMRITLMVIERVRNP